MSLFFTAQAGYVTRGITAPLIVAQTCDNRFTTVLPILSEPIWTTFSLLPKNFSVHEYTDFLANSYSMNYDICPPFRVVESAPEWTMPAEQESEITTFYDRITIKDISANTHYQIYSATGQLLQTGTTTSDISTAQLSKGFYILRLENGKVYKFVK